MNPANLYCSRHNRHYQYECAECRAINPPTPELTEETRLFLSASDSVFRYFQQSNIGNIPLNDTISECLNIKQVLAFLSLQKEYSLEFFLLRARIVIVIKNHIAAYIDGRLAPKESGEPNG